MAGHNKWSKIKRKKKAADQKRGKLFSKLTDAIERAAREGGGDIEMNATLRSAVEEAKDANMPADTIERAIKKGTGELQGGTRQEHYYEAYGPGGVALLIRTATDNINRTTAEVKHILSEHSISLGKAGSVTWLFEESWDDDELHMIPQSTVSISQEDKETLKNLSKELEDHKDVEKVFTNAE